MGKITPASLRTWSRLGQRGTFFGIAMPEIAKEKDNLKLLTADLSLLSGMDRFIRAYPEKYVNVGIAEQNMIGIAAGLAMEGDCVVASTYASFIAVRSLEHVRQHLANMKCNVKIIGTAAGVATARSGISHWATEDMAFIRALPGITLFSAADALEAYKMAYAATEMDTPVYVRLSGATNCPPVYSEDYDFVPGKAVPITKGSDVAILATGLMVSQSVKAAEILEQQGISCSVINFHTLKPLDTEMLDEVFSSYKLVVTAEEHNIIGGLGSAVAEYKATCSGNLPKQMFIGIRDYNVKMGAQPFIWEQAGLTPEGIASAVAEKMKEV
ncbi:MAG: transketolase family protein [Oscillospiraceae bacterium]